MAIQTPPAIDGFQALRRELADLRERVKALENQAGRSMAMGNSYRIQVSGTGVAALLQAVRTADGFVKQLAP